MSARENADSQQTPFALSHEHRGGLAVNPARLWPAADLATRAGGRGVIESVIDDLYRRIEHDDELSRVFPHFQTEAIKSFFVTTLGGRDRRSGASAIGPFHRGTLVTPALASRWLRHMKAALTASRMPPETAEEILDWLRPLALRLVNSPNNAADSNELVRTCNGVQTAQYQGRLAALDDAARGRLESVRESVTADPDLVNFRDAQGKSLLWQAVRRGRTALVRYLLEQPIDVNLPGCEPAVINLACSGKAGIGTGVYVTPWALARGGRRKQIVRQLENAGAVTDTFSAAWLGDLEPLAQLVRTAPEAVHLEDPAEDFRRITPLHHAVAGGQVHVAEFLINEGARVEPHSEWLLTHAAVQDRADLVELLLNSGADVHQAGVLGPLDGPSRPVADLLVRRGFDINSDSRFGAMLVRACRGDVSSREASRVEALLKYGADVNQAHHGLTALHYATRSGRTEVMELLLAHGADVNQPDHDGLTPLGQLTRTRAQIELRPILQLLFDHGADLDHQDNKGETVLFFFARRGDGRTVSWLLERGARSDVTNHSGRSVADIMRSRRSHSAAVIRRMLDNPDRA